MVSTWIFWKALITAAGRLMLRAREVAELSLESSGVLMIQTTKLYFGRTAKKASLKIPVEELAYIEFSETHGARLVEVGAVSLFLGSALGAWLLADALEGSLSWPLVAWAAFFAAIGIVVDASLSRWTTDSESVSLRLGLPRGDELRLYGLALGDAEKLYSALTPGEAELGEALTPASASVGETVSVAGADEPPEPEEADTSLS